MTPARQASLCRPLVTRAARYGVMWVIKLDFADPASATQQAGKFSTPFCGARFCAASGERGDSVSVLARLGPPNPWQAGASRGFLVLLATRCRSVAAAVAARQSHGVVTAMALKQPLHCSSRVRWLTTGSRCSVRSH